MLMEVTNGHWKEGDINFNWEVPDIFHYLTMRSYQATLGTDWVTTFRCEEK